MEKLGQELDTISERPGLGLVDKDQDVNKMGDGSVDLLVMHACNIEEVEAAKKVLKPKNEFLNNIMS